MKSQRDQRSAPPAHATGSVEFVRLADIAEDETFRLRATGDVAQLATSMGRLGQLSPIELRPWTSDDAGGPCWQVVSGFRRLAAIRLLARERVLARLHRDLPEGDAWDLAVGAALLDEPLTGDELNALRERLGASGVAPWADELIDEALVRAPVPPEVRERFYEFLTASRGPAPAAPGERTSAEPTLAPEDVGRRSEPLALIAASEPEVTSAEPTRSAAPIAATGATSREPTSPSFEEAPAPIPAPDGDATLGARASIPQEDVVEVTPEELVNDLTARLYALNQDLMTAFEAWEELPVDGRKLLVEQARYVVALLPFMEAKR